MLNMLMKLAKDILVHNESPLAWSAISGWPEMELELIDLKMYLIERSKESERDACLSALDLWIDVFSLHEKSLLRDVFGGSLSTKKSSFENLLRSMHRLDPSSIRETVFYVSQTLSALRRMNAEVTAGMWSSVARRPHEEHFGGPIASMRDRGVTSPVVKREPQLPLKDAVASIGSASLRDNGSGKVVKPTPGQRAAQRGRELLPKEDADKIEISIGSSNEKIIMSLVDEIDQETRDPSLTAYRPVDVNNNYHNGFLYYPVQTLYRDVDTNDHGRRTIKEKIETVIVRSDKTIQRVIPSDMPEDSTTSNRVYRLTDGTIVQSIPSANTHGTWRWEYIEEFIKGDVVTPNLEDMIRQIHQHLRSRVWLPMDSDYWMLALAAIVTYVQSVFDAVPLFLLNGPAGTGKSELSAAMCEVSANAVMIGQVSAPTMIRLVSESGGLVTIDDLEAVGVGKGRGGKGKFSEIAQVLKVSYKKSSATRLVTNTKTMRTEVMNFFGVKLISLTKNVDSILGSRMFQICTQNMSPDLIPIFQKRDKLEDGESEQLRNNLHTWAFENVDLVHEMYSVISADKSNRVDEIAMPLRVIAEITGSVEIKEALEEALINQDALKNHDKNPDEVIVSVVNKLLRNGYQNIAISHIMLELRKELDPSCQLEYIKSIPGWSRPEWIGRKLRELGIIDDSLSIRKRLFGANLRVVHIHKKYVQKALLEQDIDFELNRDVFDFCQSCESCPYRSHQCEIMAKRINIK